MKIFSVKKIISILLVVLVSYLAISMILYCNYDFVRKEIKSERPPEPRINAGYYEMRPIQYHVIWGLRQGQNVSPIEIAKILKITPKAIDRHMKFHLSIINGSVTITNPLQPPAGDSPYARVCSYIFGVLKSWSGRYSNWANVELELEVILSGINDVKIEVRDYLPDRLDRMRNAPANWRDFRFPNNPSVLLSIEGITASYAAGINETIYDKINHP